MNRSVLVEEGLGGRQRWRCFAPLFRVSINTNLKLLLMTYCFKVTNPSLNKWFTNRMLGANIAPHVPTSSVNSFNSVECRGIWKQHSLSLAMDMYCTGRMSRGALSVLVSGWKAVNSDGGALCYPDNPARQEFWLDLHSPCLLGQPMVCMTYALALSRGDPLAMFLWPRKHELHFLVYK